MSEGGSRYKVFWVFLVAGFLQALLQIVLTVSSYRYIPNLVQQYAIEDVDRRNSSVQRQLRAADVIQDPATAEPILQMLMEEWNDQVLWMRIVDREGKTVSEVGKPDDADVHWDRVGADIETVKHAHPDFRMTSAGMAIVEIYCLGCIPQGGGFPGRGGGGGGGGGGPAGPRNGVGGDREFGQPNGQGFPALGRGQGERGSVTPNNGAPGQRQGGGPPQGRGGQGNFRPQYAIQIAVPLSRVNESYALLSRSLTIGMITSGALLLSLILIAVRLPRYLRGQRIEGQLELARLVQTDLLAPPNVVLPQIDSAVECIPAWEVGGDFCDVFSVGRDRIAFVLGDVSGKGISAALLMGLIHGAVHSISWTDSAEDHQSATRHLNELLCKKTARERFSSLFWAYFDPGKSVLNYVNAGHLPPLLIHSDGNGHFDIKRLDVGGTVLGLISGVAYRQGSAHVDEGDLLVIFSDGISEAGDAAGEEFGEARLLDIIRESWEKSAAEIRDDVFARLKVFLHNAPGDDDQTLIISRFQHVSTRKEPAGAPQEAVPAQGL